MTLKLDPQRSDAVSAAIRRVATLAYEATLASDTQTARERLTAVRDAILDAGDTINRAEEHAREARRTHTFGEAA